MNDRTASWVKPTIEHNKLTQWNWMVSNPDNLKLGKRVDIGAFTYIQAGEGITIEDDVQIGSHCAIYSINTINETSGEIIIKHGACIGSHSVIIPKKDGTPLIIGETCRCNAFSLIYTDIPANSKYCNSTNSDNAAVAFWEKQRGLA
jgi:acetyltransferase-like isoleucine patch superfamily enzyme